jgi:hypothetical protein
MGVGVALGAATHAMAAWLAVGTGVGVAIGAALTGLQRPRG